MNLITSPAFVFLVALAVYHLPLFRPRPETNPSDRPYHQIMLVICLTLWTLLPGLGLVAMLVSVGLFDLGSWPGRINAATSGEEIVKVILPNTLLLFGIFRHIAALRPRGTA
jgi:hypothetical protein